MLTIEPWDKTLLGAIEKAVRTSNLGFNPQNDGKIIRIPIPPMTEERRKEAVKHLAGVLEDHKTSIRNHPPRRQRHGEEGDEGQGDFGRR